MAGARVVRLRVRAIGLPPKASSPQESPPPTTPPLCDQKCQDQAKPDHCVSTRESFNGAAWHVAGGAAGGTRFVLKNASPPDALTRNLEIFSDASKLEQDGQKLVILKPTLTVPHGGGQIVTAGSVEHATLVEMLERVATPVACPDDPVDPPVGDPLDGVEFLDAYGTLRKASIQIAGRLPADAEVAAVDARPDADARSRWL